MELFSKFSFKMFIAKVKNTTNFQCLFCILQLCWPYFLALIVCVCVCMYVCVCVVCVCVWSLGMVLFILFQHEYLSIL